MKATEADPLPHRYDPVSTLVSSFPLAKNYLVKFDPLCLFKSQCIVRSP